MALHGVLQDRLLAFGDGERLDDAGELAERGIGRYARCLLAIAETVHCWLSALTLLDGKRRARVVTYAEAVGLPVAESDLADADARSTKSSVLHEPTLAPRGSSEGRVELRGEAFLQDAERILDSIEAQTRACIENVKAILEAAGSSLEKVFDVTVYLTDMQRDFEQFNQVYAEYFGQIQPRLGVAYAVSPKMALSGGYSSSNRPALAYSDGENFVTLNSAGYNANISITRATRPTPNSQDPVMYLSEPYPSLSGVFPNYDPNQLNNQGVGTVLRGDEARRERYNNYNVTLRRQLPACALWAQSGCCCGRDVGWNEQGRGRRIVSRGCRARRTRAP